MERRVPHLVEYGPGDVRPYGTVPAELDGIDPTLRAELDRQIPIRQSYRDEQLERIIGS